MTETWRTFIGLDLSPQTKRQLAACIKEMKSFPTPVRWVSENNLHLTLQFLGQTPLSKIADIQTAIVQACQDQKPFPIVFNHLGAFPNLNRLQILWAGLSLGETYILSLLTQLQQKLQKIGLPLEKKAFHAHVTLGRVKGHLSDPKFALLIQQFPFAMISDVIKEVTLYKSTLTTAGPVYEKIHINDLDQV